jgi:hypothetical protein
MTGETLRYRNAHYSRGAATVLAVAAIVPPQRNERASRRARYAQYRGQKATLTLMGTTVTGLIRSVNENGSGTFKRWIVTVVAK